MAHALDIAGIEDGFENRQASGENTAAIRLDTVEVEFFSLTDLEYFAFQPGQPFGIDLAAAETGGLNGQADGLDGARGPHRIFPAEAAQAVLDTHDLQACRGVGLGVACRGDLAVLEEALGKADAAHLQAFAQQRLEALADDELGAATADIGDQAFARGVGDAVGDAEIDQARFFAPGDDFNRMAEDLFGTADKVTTVARLAQGIGADDAHRALGQAGGQLGKAAQAVAPALHGLFAEQTLLVDSGGQLHLIAEALEDA